MSGRFAFEVNVAETRGLTDDEEAREQAQEPPEDSFCVADPFCMDEPASVEEPQVSSPAEAVWTQEPAAVTDLEKCSSKRLKSKAKRHKEAKRKKHRFAEEVRVPYRHSKAHGRRHLLGVEAQFGPIEKEKGRAEAPARSERVTEERKNDQVSDEAREEAICQNGESGRDEPRTSVKEWHSTAKQRKEAKLKEVEPVEMGGVDRKRPKSRARRGGAGGRFEGPELEEMPGDLGNSLGLLSLSGGLQPRPPVCDGGWHTQKSGRKRPAEVDGPADLRRTVQPDEENWLAWAPEGTRNWTPGKRLDSKSEWG
jgi:hypothetical protein